MLKSFIYINTEVDNPITIVAQETAEGTFTLGVSRCGNADNYSEEMGVEIATNRANVKPYSTIPNCTKGAFNNYICPLIVGNFQRMVQARTKDYRRVKPVEAVS